MALKKYPGNKYTKGGQTIDRSADVRAAEREAEARRNNGIVLESKGAERDAKLAESRPGIYRFNNGTAVVSSQAVGNGFVAGRGRGSKSVFVGTKEQEQQAVEQRSVTGFNVNDANTREYLRSKASEPQSRTAGMLFAEGRREAETRTYSVNELNYTPAPPPRTRLQKIKDRIFWQPPPDPKAAQFSNFLENKETQYIQRAYSLAGSDSGSDRLKSIGYSILARPTGAAAGFYGRYGNSPNQIAIDYGVNAAGLRLGGYALGTGLNFLGSKLGAGTFNLASKTINYGLGGLAVYDVSQSSPQQIGANIPAYVGGGAGFYSGYKDAKPGRYVQEYGPVQNSNIEYRRVGNEITGFGTANGRAVLNNFGKTESVPYVANVQVFGRRAFAGNNRYYIADVELASAVQTGKASIYGSRGYGGVLDTKTGIQTLRSGDDLFVARQGKVGVVYDDVVTRLEGGNSQFVELVAPKGKKADKTGGGLGFSVAERYGYTDSRFSFYRSPAIDVTGRTAQRVGYSAVATTTVRFGSGSPQVARGGVRLAEQFGLYRAPVPSRFSQGIVGKKGSLSLLEGPQSIKPVEPFFSGRGGRFNELSSLGLRGGFGGKGASPFPFALTLGLQQSQFTAPKSNIAPRQAQFLRNNQALSLTPITSASFIPKQKQFQTPVPAIITSSSLDIRQSLRLSPVGIAIPTTTPVFPVVPLGAVPFGIPPSKGGMDFGSAGRGFRYQQDLFSQLYDVRGSAPSILTGFEVRPVQSKRKRGKRK